jgi:hypothetical protein
MSRKNSTETNGNRNRDHPACSAVTLPTALPHAPHKLAIWVDKFTAGLTQIEFEGVNLINLAHDSDQ